MQEPVASYAPLRELVFAFLLERLARRLVGSAELDEAFVARQGCILETELSLFVAALVKTVLRSQICTLQTDLSAACAEIATGRSFADLATLALSLMCTDREWLEIQMAGLPFTVNDMRLKPEAAQSSVSSAAFDLLCGKHDQYTDFFLFLNGQFDHLDDTSIHL